MSILRFVFNLIILLIVVLGLNRSIGTNPPIGKFLDPFHGFWQNATAKKVTLPDEVQDKTLQSEVNVYYDSLLVPHIKAGNRQDLFFAQGFVTAAHRLWQMDFQTRVASGRISEIIGPEAIPFDRKKRREGLPKAAEEVTSKMLNDTSVAPLLKSYTRGVNAYIKSLDPADYPLEFKLLNYDPQPWKPLHTAQLLQFMADNLTSKDKDFEDTYALKHFGKDIFNDLFPEKYEGTRPIIPSEKRYRFNPLDDPDEPDNYLAEAVDLVPSPEEILDSVKQDKEKQSYRDKANDGLFGDFRQNLLHYIQRSEKSSDYIKGSNNWAISGDRTESGKPILANDTHLSLSLPSAWYMLHLNAPGINTMGATLPGAPTVILGMNDSIAWGMTNARRDVRDWYKIDFANKNQEDYRFNDKMLKAQERQEKIQVRGEEPLVDTVTYTHLGPVVYDNSFSSEDPLDKAKKHFALRWLTHDPSNELKTFFEINIASGYNDFKKAMQYFQCPAQNFAFASVQGDIAMHVQGKFPLKWQNQGKFVLEGKPAHEANKFIPQEHNPYIVNPRQDYLASANQYPVAGNYPYYVYDYRYGHFRHRRINDRLEKEDNWTVDKVKDLQTDVYNYETSMILPLMLDNLNKEALSEDQKEVFETLEQWNYDNQANAKAPAYFHVWYDSLHRLVWDEIYDAKTGALMQAPDKIRTIRLLKETPKDTFIDIKHTPQREQLADILNTSFNAMHKAVSKWKENHDESLTWGVFQGTNLVHLTRESALSRMDLPTSGCDNCINANKENHGASVRFIASMERPVKGWFIYPGGQSGNPGSYYYDNLVDEWLKGTYHKMQFPSSEEAWNATEWKHTINFKP